MELTINPELRDELPPLDSIELDHLTASIDRDGVLDSIKYWWNEDTQANEIVDGHHRFEIATKLQKEFTTHELVFESITAVKLWQNQTQTGRRKHRALERMVELETQLRLERDGVKPKVSEVVEAVAESANVHPATVYRHVAKAKMGYENKFTRTDASNGDSDDNSFVFNDEFDQTLPSEGFIEGVTDDEFNQAEPTDEQRQAIKDAQPKRVKRPTSIDSKQRNALKGYEFALNKIQGLSAYLPASVELPDFKLIFASIEKAKGEMAVKKPRFGR